jgi:hypothetical protein
MPKPINDAEFKSEIRYKKKIYKNCSKPKMKLFLAANGKKRKIKYDICIFRYQITWNHKLSKKISSKKILDLKNFKKLPKFENPRVRKVRLVRFFNLNK